MHEGLAALTLTGFEDSRYSTCLRVKPSQQGIRFQDKIDQEQRSSESIVDARIIQAAMDGHGTQHVCPVGVCFICSNKLKS